MSTIVPPLTAEQFATEYRHCVAAIVQALKRFEGVADCAVGAIEIQKMDVTTIGSRGSQFRRRIVLEVSPNRGEWEEA